MKKYVFSIIFFTSIQIICAQNTNPLDKNNNPPESSVFGKNSASSKKGASSERKPNVFGLVLTDFARSNLRFGYERQLTSGFAMTVGAGLSFGTDFVEKQLNLYFFSEDENYNSVPSERLLTKLYEDSKAVSGYQYSVSLRKHFGDDISTSLFLDIGWRRMHNKYSLVSFTDYNPNSYDFNTKINHFTFLMGYSFAKGKGAVVFSHELSYGFGLKITYWDKYANTQIYDPIRNTNFDYYTKNGQSSSMINLTFLIRYQLGFGW